MALTEALGKAASGGVQGASLGSSFGPWGALAGLGLGAAAGGISSALSKSPKRQQISRLQPWQEEYNKERGQIGIEGLRNPYAGFEPIEQSAREQFQQSTIPSLAERFTAMGSGGQRSSAFQGALGQAGAGLEGNLAALRSQYGLQNRQLSGGLLNQSLQPTFDTNIQEQTPGFLESSLGSLSKPLFKYGLQQTLGNGQESNGLEGLEQFSKNPELINLFQQFLKSNGYI